MKNFYISPSVSEYEIGVECGFCGSKDIYEGTEVGLGDEYQGYYDEEE